MRCDNGSHDAVHFSHTIYRLINLRKYTVVSRLIFQNISFDVINKSDDSHKSSLFLCFQIRKVEAINTFGMSIKIISSKSLSRPFQNDTQTKTHLFIERILCANTHTARRLVTLYFLIKHVKSLSPQTVDKVHICFRSRQTHSTTRSRRYLANRLSKKTADHSLLHCRNLGFYPQTSATASGS